MSWHREGTWLQGPEDGTAAPPLRPAMGAGAWCTARGGSSRQPLLLWSQVRGDDGCLPEPWVLSRSGPAGGPAQLLAALTGLLRGPETPQGLIPPAGRSRHRGPQLMGARTRAPHCPDPGAGGSSLELGTGRYLTSWPSLLTDWFPLRALVRRKGWVTHGRRQAQCFHSRSPSYVGCSPAYVCPSVCPKGSSQPGSASVLPHPRHLGLQTLLTSWPVSWVGPSWACEMHPGAQPSKQCPLHTPPAQRPASSARRPVPSTYQDAG